MPARTATESDGPDADPRPALNQQGAATAVTTTSACSDKSLPVDPEPAAAPDSGETGQPRNSTIAAPDGNEPPQLADRETISPNDEALMHALCNGNDAALATLMQRWELPVKSFLLRLGVLPADVEDVAQEAFVRLYLKRAAYRSGAPFKPWLLTLAANLGRNRMRWRIRRREHSIDIAFASEQATTDASPTVAPPLTDTSSPEPWQIVEQKQRRAAVRAIVAALPPKLRDAIMCVDLEELSHAEAAQVLGCTPKAIENRVRRARQKLRQEAEAASPLVVVRQAHAQR